MQPQNTKIDKWRNICRFCMKPENKMHTIFGRPNTEKLGTEELVKKIELCGGFLVEEDNSLMPNQICEKCLKVVETSMEFRTLCQRSFRTWAQIEARMSSPLVPMTSTGNVPIDEDISSLDDSENETFEVLNSEEVELEDDEDLASDETFKSDGFYMEDHLNENEDERMLDSGSQVDDDSSRQTATSHQSTYDSKLLQENEENNSVTSEYNYDVEIEKDTANVLDDAVETKLEIVSLAEAPVEVAIVEGEALLEREERPKENLKPGGNIRSEGGYICCYCGNMYKDRTKLNLHMKLHTKQKIHECEICHKRFAQTPQLQRHMNSHTGSRPYNCQFCDSKFADPSTRIKHERIHTKERPYECKICKKSFAYSNVLKVHIKTHTGDRPYSCEFCDKKFSQLHHKKSHVRTHSKV